jgi:S1-C subfamily serine protease
VVRRAFVLAVLAAACAPRVRTDYTVPSDEDDPAAQPAERRMLTEQAPVTQAATPAPAPVEVSATGAIARGELATVLDAGPAAFLQTLNIEPSFTEKRFQGWEIRKMPPDGRFARADLGVGDVVTRVNGKALERPEAFQDLWESLRFASELVVEYRRQGKPRELRFAITE